jgi:hypothetical protein
MAFCSSNNIIGIIGVWVSKISNLFSFNFVRRYSAFLREDSTIEGLFLIYSIAAIAAAVDGGGSGEAVKR